MGRIELALASPEEDCPKKQEQLLAWKVHIYIQKSRKAQEEAETILDELRDNLSESSPLVLPLKLQKNQFLIQKGEGRTVLKEVKAAWEKEQSIDSLYCYMMALTELDRTKDLLELWEQDAVQQMVKCINEETVPLWQTMFCSAAAEEEETYFVNQLERFKTEAGDVAVFEAEWIYAGLLKKLGREAEKENRKKQLLEKIENLAINEYLKINYVKRIQAL